jgi:uncharacterized lipoprotein YddW (UPF0748 family)
MNGQVMDKNRDFKPHIWLFLMLLLLSGLPVTAQLLYPKFEFRGVWVATVNNIDWPSRPGLTTEQQKKEVIDLLDLHQGLGMNAVIFQVRPCSDAFYPSQLEPWSRYLTGTPGRVPSPFWDPLQFWIEEAHKRNMELHAWLNPYRLAQNTTEPLAGNHQVFDHPEWVIRYGDKLILDPGIPGTRAYVTAVICDIVRRYDIDGIHMDDYFYPYPTRDPFPDDRSFALYNRAFPASEKESWRRENVDILIKSVSDTIKAIKPWVKFGISPFGVWRNQKDDPQGSATQAGVTNYDHLYADVRKWLREGWIDYVTPQIYWEIGHKLADFETLCQWWNDNVFGRQLYIGLAPYKLEKGAREPAWRSARQLPAQLRMLRQYPNISGSVFFSSRQFKRNLFGLQDSLKRHFYRYPSLTPPLNWMKLIKPNPPQKLTTSGRKVSWEAPEATSPVAMPTRYILYLTERGSPLNPASSSLIAGYTGATRAVFPRKGKKKTKYDLWVSTLDRYNNESDPAGPVRIKW